MPENVQARTPHSFDNAWSYFCESDKHTCATLHVHDLYMIFMCFVRRGGMLEVQSQIHRHEILQDALEELSRVIIKWRERLDWSLNQLISFYQMYFFSVSFIPSEILKGCADT